MTAFKNLFKLIFFAFILLVISAGYRFLSGDKSETDGADFLFSLHRAEADAPPGGPEGDSECGGPEGESNESSCSCY